MKRLKSLVVLSACISLLVNLFAIPQIALAANLGVTKDTLQSSRISFNGRVKSPTASGSSHVWMYTTSSTPYFSINTANLHAGDTVVIGTGTYTIDGIVDDDEFTLTTTLAAGDADDTDPIYLKSKPQHVITFTTASAVANGFFQVLVPAASAGSNDGVADTTGFDFGGGTIDVTPTNATGYTFSNNAATASGGTYCTAPANYHCFEFHYSGAGGVGTAINLTVGQTSGTNSLIAPAPANTALGAAESYKVIVKNFTNGSNPATATATDQTSTTIGLIEAVRVSATVDPSITFTITGVAAAQTVCGTGSTTDVDTTTAVNQPVAVPFGTMSLNAFKTAAHLLTVSTNGQNGYVVTAVEDDQLGLGGGTSPFIIDTDCTSTACTEVVQQNWNVATGYPGFGYTLATGSGTTMAFVNDNTFKSRKFPSLADTESPITIMSSTGVSNSHTGYICYRLAVDATQAAGDYENMIIYTATATF